MQPGKAKSGASAKTIMTVSVVGAVLTGAASAVADEFFTFDEDLVFATLLAAAGVVGGVVTVFYWPRLDEAAREAHKVAWLWGGSGGLFLAILALPLLLARGSDRLPSLFFERQDAAGALANSVLACFMLQFVGMRSSGPFGG